MRVEQIHYLIEPIEIKYARLGFHFCPREDTQRDEIDAGLLHQSFFTTPNNQTAVAVAGYSLSQGLGPATLAWRFEATPSLEDLSNYHFRSDASITTSIVWGIGLRLGAVNEFNNRPQPGVKKHDMLLTTTVTYSIGH